MATSRSRVDHDQEGGARPSKLTVAGLEVTLMDGVGLYRQAITPMNLVS